MIYSDQENNTQCEIKNHITDNSKECFIMKVLAIVHKKHTKTDVALKIKVKKSMLDTSRTSKPYQISQSITCDRKSQLQITS